MVAALPFTTGPRVLNLGAGVQSTALALMSHRGEIEKFDCAIFADTGEEPRAVYRHLEWLISEVKDSYPVMVRSVGMKLGDSLLNGLAPTGRSQELSTGGRFASIPAFTSDIPGENQGIVRRQCTKEFKTSIIERTIRRELCGMQPGQRLPKAAQVHQYLGLSYDEPGRVFRVRKRLDEIKWCVPHFPLFERSLTRADCVAWLEAYGVPHRTPRSACVFCPYHSNEEWAEIKAEDPEGWARSLEIDDAIRQNDSRAQQGLSQKLYLHRQCVPLRDADLRDKDTRTGQMLFGMEQECEGMCGS